MWKTSFRAQHPSRTEPNRTEPNLVAPLGRGDDRQQVGHAPSPREEVLSKQVVAVLLKTCSDKRGTSATTRADK